LAGWILTIDENYPQHIDYAVAGGFWDTSKRFGIQPGDDLFFWQNGPQRRLVAYCVATTSLDPIGHASQPWDDAGRRTYRHRVYMQVRAREASESPTWGRLQELIGSGAFANTSVIGIKAADGVDTLRALFSQADIVWRPEITIEFDPHDPAVQEYSTLLDLPEEQDERRASLRAVVVRRGQPRFRNDLLARYRHCLVTRFSAPAVLEAAHISPYRGDTTNDVRNGLLLRSDIHTLFDLNLLTITPDYVIRVSPDLVATPYGGFDTDSLSFPAGESLRPDRGMLERHNANSSWLAGDG
jgi:hypothetical protein